MQLNTSSKIAEGSNISVSNGTMYLARLSKSSTFWIGGV